MNKIFKVIWNEASQTWVAVSELTKAKGKRSSSSKRKLLSVSVLFALGVSTPIHAYLGIVDSNTINHTNGPTGNLGQTGALTGRIEITDNGRDDQAVVIGAMLKGADDPNKGNGQIIPSSTYRTPAQSVTIGNNIIVDKDARGSISIGGDDIAPHNRTLTIANGGTFTWDPISFADKPRTPGYISPETKGIGAINIGALSKVDGTVATGLGVNTNVTGSSASAFGAFSTAQGTSATALGSASSALAEGALAIGAGSNATGLTSTAISVNSSASAARAIAFGYNSQSSGERAVAIGTNSSSSAQSAVSIGDEAKASGLNSYALGVRANSSNEGSIAMGTDSIANNTKSIAIGGASKSSGDKSIAIGDQAHASNQGAFAMGSNAQSSGIYSTAIGVNATSNASAGVAIGNRANATTGASAMAIGQDSFANSSSSLALGQKANATAASATAIGLDSKAQAFNSIALGRQAEANGSHSVALGLRANTTSAHALAFGTDSKAQAQSSVAIGQQANATGTNSIATGWNATASGDRAISIGSGSASSGSYSTALGGGAKALGASSSAFGHDSNASAEKSIAIGHGATASDVNSVALGSASATRLFTNENVGTVRGITYDGFAANTTVKGVVSVGTVGNERQIVNVAAGNVSASSTDAINGSQLFAVANQINWKVQATNTGNQVTPVNGTGTTENEKIYANDTLKLNAGKNLVVNQNGQTVTYGLAENIDVKSITTSGLTMNPNSVVNMGGNNVTNVRNGTAPTDAVNVQQLNESAWKLTTQGRGAANEINPSDTVHIVGKAGTPIYVSHSAESSNTSTVEISLNTTTLINDAGKVDITNGGNSTDLINAGNLKEVINNTFWKVTQEGTPKDNVQAGDTINFKKGSKTTLTVTSDGQITDVTYDIDTTTITTGTDGKATATDDSKVATAGDVAKAINDSGFIAKATQSNGTATGGANELVKTGETLELDAGKNIEITQTGKKFSFATKNEVTFDKVTVGNTVIDSSGIHAGDNKITNVADGESPTDAVNVKQLNESAWTLQTSQDNGTASKVGDINRTDKVTIDGKGIIKVTNTVESASGESKVHIAVETQAINTNNDGKAQTNGNSSVGGNTTNAPNNNALATAGDVINVVNNASWSIFKDNGKINDVKAGNSVHFQDSDSVSASVTQNGTDKTNISFTIKNTALTNNDGKVAVPNPTTNSNQFVNAGDLATAINNTYWKVSQDNVHKDNIQAGDTLNFKKGARTSLTVNTDGIKTDVTYDIETQALKVENGKAGLDGTTTNGNLAVTADDVVKVVNEASHTVSTTTVSDQITQLNGTTTIKAGDTLNFKAGKNLVANQNGKEIAFGLAQEIAVNKVTVGDNTNNTVISSTNQGLDVGGDTITNVGSGLKDDNGNPTTDINNANNTNAVNVGDLKTVVNNSKWTLFTSKDDANATQVGEINPNDEVIIDGKGAVKVSNTTETGGKSKVHIEIENTQLSATDGKINTPATTDGNKFVNATDLADAINKAGFKATSSASAGEVAGTSTPIIKAGDTITYDAGKNIKITQTDGKFSFATKDNVEFTSANIGGVTINNGGVDMGNKNINNVAPATQGHQAVNLDQLNSTVAGSAWKLSTSGNDTANTINPNNQVKFEGTGALEITHEAKDTNGLSKVKVSVNTTNTFTTDATRGTVSSANPNNIATAGQVTDAINSVFWKVGDKDGTVKHQVKAGHQVNFINGEGTTSVVTDANNTGVNTVTFNVNKGTIDSDTNTGRASTTTGGNNFTTAEEVVKAINNAGFVATASASDGQVANPSEQLIKTSEKVTFDAGKNIKITQDGKKFSFATKDNVEFTSANIGGVTINNNGIDAGGKPITNVNNGLTTHTAGNPTGLVNLNNPAVNDNTVATVGDLRNMGWVVSSDKTTDSLANPFNAQVRNTQEVKFVGIGLATVSGKTDGDVRTITVDVNAQAVTNNAQLPVVYTNTNGDKVYKQPDNTFNTNPDGTGTTVPNTQVIASMNNPANDPTTPTTLTNVAGNLPNTYNNDVYNTAGTAPTTAQALPDGNNSTTKLNVNNAATVGDVLNSGWNVQENGTGKDFVKAYDTVNFVNGTGTTAKVTVDGDGKVSNVTFNSALGFVNTTTPTDTSTPTDTAKLVGNNPVQIQNVASGVRDPANPTPSSKDVADAIKNATGNTLNNAVNVGDLQAVAKASKTEVKSDGQTITVTPSVGTNGQDVFNVEVSNTQLVDANNDGKIDAPNTTDGNKFVNATDLADAINKAGFKATSSASAGEVAGTSEELINAGDTITYDAGKNIKVTQANGKFTFATKDNVSFNEVKVPTDPTNPSSPSITINNNGLDMANKPITNVNNGLTTHTSGKPTGLVNLDNPNVDNKTVATVGDLRNMGWVVTTEQNGYSDQVRNTNEVAFKGTGLATVKGVTSASGVREITVDVNSQNVVQTAQLPVVYTNANGDKVYKLPNGTFNTQPDGSGTTVQPADVIASINSGNGQTQNDPTTLANVKGNLPNTYNQDAYNTNNQPVSTSQALPNDLKVNNAATVGDVLNSGWNLQANGTGKDFVKPYDTVNFVDGRGTTVVATTSADGKTSTIKLDTPISYVDNAGNPQNTPSNTVNLFGIGNNPVQIGNVASGVRDPANPTPTGKEIADAVKNAVGDTLNNAVNVGDLQAVANASKTKVVSDRNTIAVNETEGANGEAIYHIDVANTQLTTTDGKVNAPSASDANKFVNAGDLANTINNTGWNIGNNGTNKGLIKAGAKVDFVDGVGTTAVVDYDADGNAKVKINAQPVNITAGNNAITVTGDSLNGYTITPNTADLTNNNGKVEAPSASDGSKLVNATTVANAINNAGFTLKTSADGGQKLSGADELINSGEALDLSAGKNLTVKQDANGKVTFATADDVSFNKVSVDGVVIDNAGINAGGKKITNVANGTDPNDAVNLSQLQAMTGDAHLNFKGNSGTVVKRNNGQTLNIVGSLPTSASASSKNVRTVSSGDKVEILISENPEFNSVTTGNLNANGNVNLGGNGKTVQIAGGSNVDMGGNVLHNVGAGVNDTDAVNVSQLRGLNTTIVNNVQNITQNINAITDKLADQDKVLSGMASYLGDTNKRLRGGVASAYAAAQLPQPFLPGKSMIVAGTAYHEGESAIAVGYSTISDNGKLIIRVSGAANSAGDKSVGAGIGYQW